jgi:hypothetical protein
MSSIGLGLYLINSIKTRFRFWFCIDVIRRNNAYRINCKTQPAMIFKTTSSSLSESSKGQGVSSQPACSVRGSDLSFSVALNSQTSTLLTGGSQTSQFSVLVDGIADPVDLGVVSDGLVGSIDENDFVVFISGILGNPVRVEDSEATDLSADSFFSDGSQVSGELELNDTLVGGLTADDTLSDGLLSATSSDSNSVDDVTLLGLVSESSGLIRSGRSGASVDGGELSVFPSSETKNEVQNVRLLLLPKFFKVFVGTH